MTLILSWLIIACIAVAYGLWCYRTGFDLGVAETRKMMREYVERHTTDALHQTAIFSQKAYDDIMKGGE